MSLVTTSSGEILTVPTFADEEASRELYYAEFLENNKLWIPYVKAVCKKHSLPVDKIKGDHVEILSHYFTACLKPGTFPVLIVDTNYAVKLYTKYRTFLDGEEVYLRELKAYAVLSEANPELAKKFPIIVANGTLLDQRTEENKEGGYIHYMVTTYLPGVPVSDIFCSFTRDQVKKFARDLGEIMKEVHQLVPEKQHFSLLRWENFIKERRTQCFQDLKEKWKSLPDHFLEQLDDFLPKDMHQFLVEAPTNGFLHCDISQEHILMSKSTQGEWEITGFLDWGDARYGDIHYELSVIHVDHWKCDKELLQEFIKGYNAKNPDSDFSFEASAAFTYRSMVYLLLFEFNCFQNLDSGKGIFCLHPEWKNCSTLQKLAENLWDLTTPY